MNSVLCFRYFFILFFLLFLDFQYFSCPYFSFVSYKCTVLLLAMGFFIVLYVYLTIQLDQQFLISWEIFIKDLYDGCVLT